jgi:hypothetical protein
MSHDESDDLAYNPFAEQYDDSSRSTQAQGYFNSAFFPRISSAGPTLRRRRSSLADRAPLKGTEGLKKHLRSRTEIRIVPHSAGLHPLKSALAVANGAVFQDVGVTRPHLSRIVNEGTLIDVPSAEIDVAANKTTPSSDEEKEVIVHKVCHHTFLQLQIAVVDHVPGDVKGFSGWCLLEIWHLIVGPPKSKPALVIGLNTSSRTTLYPCRPGISCPRIYPRAVIDVVFSGRTRRGGQRFHFNLPFGFAN